MQLNLFSIPIFIGNIDPTKLEFKNQKTKPTFDSGVHTSFASGNENLEKESFKYLANTIIKLLEEKFKRRFRITFSNIWQNIYKKDDFQEKHCHVNSHFSFIVYKKIKESNTIFFHPNNYLIASFYKGMEGPKPEDIVDLQFRPSCREGQIIVFPSFLEHMVKKTSNAITISGNIDFKFL